jgi:hypothetical protein
MTEQEICIIASDFTHEDDFKNTHPLVYNEAIRLGIKKYVCMFMRPTVEDRLTYRRLCLQEMFN